MPPLIKLILRRLALGTVTLLAVSALMFVGIELLPGDLAQQILSNPRLRHAR
jgi:peptide/nickel transport system permease protein